jgi:hypothetical protein
MVATVATLPSEKACSISAVSAAAKSTAARRGKAPMCCGFRILARTALGAIERARYRLRPLLRQEISAIGRQPQKEIVSFFIFGIKTTLARFQLSGKPCSIAFKYRRWTICLMWGHAAFSSRTVIPSTLGEVELTPMVCFSTSSRVGFRS